MSFLIYGLQDFAIKTIKDTHSFWKALISKKTDAGELNWWDGMQSLYNLALAQTIINTELLRWVILFNLCDVALKTNISSNDKWCLFLDRVRDVLFCLIKEDRCHWQASHIHTLTFSRPSVWAHTQRLKRVVNVFVPLFYRGRSLRPRSCLGSTSSSGNVSEQILEDQYGEKTVLMCQVVKYT